jgi:hypothetical protein
MVYPPSSSFEELHSLYTTGHVYGISTLSIPIGIIPSFVTYLTARGYNHYRKEPHKEPQSSKSNRTNMSGTPAMTSTAEKPARRSLFGGKQNAAEHGGLRSAQPERKGFSEGFSLLRWLRSVLPSKSGTTALIIQIAWGGSHHYGRHGCGRSRRVRGESW